MSEKAKPLPVFDEISRAWFAAAAEGKLLIQRSRSTGRFQFYPRAHSLGTLLADLEWIEASGRGRLHTFTVVERTANPEFAEDCPYILAIVALEEGPLVTTRIVDIPANALWCDMPVRVVFRDLADGIVAPFFTGIEAT